MFSGTVMFMSLRMIKAFNTLIQMKRLLAAGAYEAAAEDEQSVPVHIPVDDL